ncbi:MAG TPA: glutamate 5-kinase [Nitrospiria bacterium]
MVEFSRQPYLNAVKRVVVKIGSNLIASRDQGLNHSRLESLARELGELRNQKYDIIVVTSGAILAGLEKLGIHPRPKSMPIKQAAAAVGQSRLMWAYEKAFEGQGLHVAQVLVTQDDLSDRRRFLNSRNTVTTLLRMGVIPIINENDSVVVDEIRFGDNDTLAGMVAHLVDAQLLIVLSDVEGLYTDDPRRNPEARLISDVSKVDSNILKIAGESSSGEGTGGMRSKVKAAIKAGEYGVPTVIAGGRRTGVITEVLKGNAIGTIILPGSGKRQSRKQWIAQASRARGRIMLDEGAVEAICEKGRSLLPSGVKNVEGEFKAGDTVSCTDSHGREIARGLVNYPSPEVLKIKGLRSSEIKKTLGYKDYDEVIHRDNLVVFKKEKA